MLMRHDFNNIVHFYSNAKHILPSYLKRKATVGGKDSAKRKKTKSVTTWDRDIICLPKQTKNGEVMSVVTYPRSRYRSQLGGWGVDWKNPHHITNVC